MLHQLLNINRLTTLLLICVWNDFSDFMFDDFDESADKLRQFTINISQLFIYVSVVGRFHGNIPYDCGRSSRFSLSG